MKRGWCLSFILGMVLFFFSAGALWAQPDTLTLQNPTPQKSGRPPVPFPHSRHIERGLSCKECHHRYDQGKNVLDEGELEEGKPGIRCQECHGPKVRPDLQTAFHKQCLDCHQTYKKEGKKTGPLFCGECHVKK